MPTYRAQGFITVTVVAEYKAANFKEAESRALDELDREANELLGGLDIENIENIEVELSEEE